MCLKILEQLSTLTKIDSLNLSSNNEKFQDDEIFENLCQSVNKINYLDYLNLFGNNVNLSTWKSCTQSKLVEFKPSDFGFDVESLKTVENITALYHCIRRQTNLETLNLEKCEGLKQDAIVKIFEACKETTKLKRIPAALYSEKKFLENDTNVEILCECIRQ